MIPYGEEVGSSGSCTYNNNNNNNNNNNLKDFVQIRNDTLVIQALLWLCEHNPLYSAVQVNNQLNGPITPQPSFDHQLAAFIIAYSLLLLLALAHRYPFVPLNN